MRHINDGMRKRTFTLSLDPTVASRIEETVTPFGGTVVSFAAQLTEDMGKLEVADQVEVRALITAKLKRLYQTTKEETPSKDIGQTPAIPHPIPRSKAKQHAEAT